MLASSGRGSLYYEHYTHPLILIIELTTLSEGGSNHSPLPFQRVYETCCGRGSQHSSDSPQGAASSPSASLGSGGNGNGNGAGAFGRTLPPLSPASAGEVGMGRASSGRMLRASDLVRTNSSASSEEPAMMRRHNSSSTGLPSSLMQGFGNTRPPSPGSSEEALFRGHLMGVPLPGVTTLLASCSNLCFTCDASLTFDL